MVPCAVLDSQEDWAQLEATGQKLLQTKIGGEWIGAYRMCAWAAQKQEAYDRQLEYLQQLLALLTRREEDPATPVGYDGGGQHFAEMGYRAQACGGAGD